MDEDGESAAPGPGATTSICHSIPKAKPAPLFRRDTTTLGKPGFLCDELGNLKIVNWATRCPCTALIIGQFSEASCVAGMHAACMQRRARREKTLIKHVLQHGWAINGNCQ